MCARVETFTPSRHIEYTREIPSETADNAHANGRMILIISSLSIDNIHRFASGLIWSAAVFDLFTADTSFSVFTIYKGPSLVVNSQICDGQT